MTYWLFLIRFAYHIRLLLSRLLEFSRLFYFFPYFIGAVPAFQAILLFLERFRTLEKTIVFSTKEEKSSVSRSLLRLPLPHKRGLVSDVFSLRDDVYKWYTQ